MRAILKYIKRILRKDKQKDKPKGFEWIDGEDADDDEVSVPLPMFYEGDTVQLWNPYEGGFIIEDFFAMEPERYRVLDVKYDKQQEVFRYKLERLGGTVINETDVLSDEDGVALWISEEWLSLPSVTNYASKEASELRVRDDLAAEKERLEGEMAISDMEADLRSREIDRMLDIMNEGTEEERKEAEKELRRLTAEGKKQW